MSRIPLEVHRQLAVGIKAYEKACSAIGKISKDEAWIFKKLQRIKSELDNLLMKNYQEFSVGQLSEVYYGNS